MKQKSKRQKKWSKKSRVILSLVVLLVIGILVGLYFNHRSSVVVPDTNANKKVYVPASPNDNDLNNDRKNSTSPAPTLDNGSSTPTPSTTSTSFTDKITGINPTTDSNGNPEFHIGTMVFGLTSGTCSLTGTQVGEATLTLGSSAVQQDVNSDDCGVFNIPYTTFPSPGSWQITLTVTSNGTQATDSQTVNVPNTN